MIYKEGTCVETLHGRRRATVKSYLLRGRFAVWLAEATSQAKRISEVAWQDYSRGVYASGGALEVWDGSAIEACSARSHIKRGKKRKY